MSEDLTPLEKRVAKLEEQMKKIVDHAKEESAVWLKIYENLKGESE